MDNKIQNEQGDWIYVTLIMDNQDGTATFEDSDGNRYRRYWATEVRRLEFW